MDWIIANALNIASFAFGVAGWICYALLRRRYNTQEKDAAAQKAKQNTKINELETQLENQKSDFAATLESEKTSHENALQNRKDELIDANAEVDRLRAICDFQAEWPRAHFNTARQRPIGFFLHRLLTDGLDGTHPWIQKIGEVMGDPTGQDTSQLAPTTEIEAIATAAGLSQARRELAGISDSGEWQVMAKQLWAQFERHAKAERQIRRSGQFSRGRGISGGGGGPKPQPDINPGEGPAPAV